MSNKNINLPSETVIVNLLNLHNKITIKTLEFQEDILRKLLMKKCLQCGPASSGRRPPVSTALSP